MSSHGCRCDEDRREELRQIASGLGIVRVGFAEAAPVDDEAEEYYRHWIASRRHAGMEYMERYSDVRSDPRLLLEGARTVISCAVAYPAPPVQAPGTLRIASYALGRDYHEVVRMMLFELAARAVDIYGGSVRVCVDTAPIRERYWAVRSGIGFVGRNNQLIVPGIGSRVFLGEIITTARIPADKPCALGCEGCMACVKACPGKALDGLHCVDSMRCLSYLTIEHRGELPAGTSLRGHFYGCDVCQDVCPHNRVADDSMVPSDLRPRPGLLTLTAGELSSYTSGDYRRLTSHSAMRRAPLRQLLRNAGALDADE
ncbi:MAG: tRNA epoxyqueuosine(34) reductase QueG [Muribaculaceae bacterium]|nr:tRNA epoxyqueuosine(34) reductase QueG [Muribaculaceae bacterium]